jgi:hypothetical protein
MSHQAAISRTPSERALYHQIHPAKLATDWAAGLVGAVLLWHHRLAAGLLWGLVPPVITSAPFLLGWFDRTLTRYQASAMGRYVARSMTHAMEGLRLLGLAGLWVGAWERRPGFIAAGLALIVGAWLRGLLWAGGSSTRTAE